MYLFQNEHKHRHYNNNKKKDQVYRCLQLARHKLPS